MASPLYRMTANGDVVVSKAEYDRLMKCERELEERKALDAVTIPRAELERMRDAERIAWGLRKLSKAPFFPRIELWQSATHGHEWMLQESFDTDSEFLGEGPLPVLTDEARSIIDAAMAREKEADRG